jgi:protocatechuate 3,4-dioxygenase beta subunit
MFIFEIPIQPKWLKSCAEINGMNVWANPEPYSAAQLWQAGQRGIYSAFSSGEAEAKTD